MCFAYDLSPAEEQERMMREIGETGDTTVGKEVFNRGRAAAKMSSLDGETREEGLKKLETLEAASDQIPGIKNLLQLLGESVPKLPNQPKTE